MGVYITLEIIPQRILPEEWVEVYYESLDLLNAYHGGIMGYKKEYVGSLERICYSRTFEHDPGRPEKRYWYVVGDFASMKRAESFELHYDLQYYKTRGRSDEHPYDILIDAVFDSSGKGGRRGKSISVFCEKTQGEPYHFPLLAIASLIESRFTPYAIAGGDIDIGQAKRTVEWANTILKKKIDLPVRVQPDRLYERITKCFEGQEAIKACRDVFRGSSDEMYDVLFKKCDRSTLIQWLMAELREYKSPHQLGAIALFTNWLNVSVDIEALCELACINANGPRFDPVEFASSLCSTWVSIEPKSYNCLEMVKKPEGAAESVAGQFGRAFLDMAGYKGRNIKCYIDEENLLKVFKEKFPNHIDKIKTTIQPKMEKIRSDLLAEASCFEEGLLKSIGKKDHKELLQMIDKMGESEDSEGKDVLLFFESYEELTDLKKDMLKILAYRLRELKSRGERESSEILHRSNKEKQHKIISITRDAGIRLTEDAWAWIDKEKERAILDIILILVLVKSWEQTFWNMRLAVCENRKLCKEILRLMADKEAMSKAFRLIEETGTNEK